MRIDIFPFLNCKLLAAELMSFFFMSFSTHNPIKLPCKSIWLGMSREKLIRGIFDYRKFLILNYCLAMTYDIEHRNSLLICMFVRIRMEEIIAPIHCAIISLLFFLPSSEITLFLTSHLTSAACWDGIWIKYGPKIDRRVRECRSESRRIS